MAPAKVCMASALVAAALFCSPAWAAESAKQVESEVRGVVEKQIVDWNHGDLSAFLDSYMQSPDTSYVSDDGEIFGYDSLLARYVQKYGMDKKSMGKLAFSQLRVVDLGPENALCVGHWSVQRNAGTPVEGICSLVLKHTKDGWKIIHDHSSSNLNLIK